MAPKSKKKGVHTKPEIHPQVLKNRAQREVQAQKKAARFLKMTKRKRKLGITGIVSPTDDGANITEPSSHETSIEDSVAQESTDLSISTSPQPSKSGIEEQEWINLFDNNKSNKKTRNACKSEEENPTSVSQTDESNSQKNTSEIGSIAGQSSAPTMVFDYSDVQRLIKEHGEVPPGGSFKMTIPFKLIVNEPQTPETPRERSSKLKKSFKTPEPEDIKTQKEAKGLKQSKGIDIKTGHVSSKSTSRNYPEDASLQKDGTKTQKGLHKKDFAKKKEENETMTTRKDIKNKTFTKSNLQRIPSKVPSEELANKKSSLEKKLEFIETEKKHLDEQEKLLPPLTPQRVFKTPGITASGIIKIFPLEKSFEKNEETFLDYTIKGSYTKIFQIKDKNVKISIVVFEGTQVICKHRQRPKVNPCKDDLESCPQTLKIHDKLISNEELEPEHHNETPTDFKRVGQIDQGSSPLTLKAYSSATMDKNLRSDPKMQDKFSANSRYLDQDDLSTITSAREIKSDPELRKEIFDESSNLNQHVESFPITSEGHVRYDPDLHEETFTESNNLNQDVETLPETLEGRSLLTSDNNTKSDVELHKKIFSDPRNMEQDYTEFCPLTLDVRSLKTFDEGFRSDPGLHDEISSDLTILDQDVESYFRELEGHSAVTMDKNVSCDSEPFEKLTADTSNLSLDDGKLSSLTLEARSTTSLNKDFKSDPNLNGKISRDLEQDAPNQDAPQIMDGHSTPTSNEDDRCDSKLIEEITAKTRNLSQDQKESLPFTLEVQSTIALDKDISSDPRLYSEISPGSSDMYKDVELFPSIMEGHSAVTLANDAKSDPKLHKEILEFSHLDQDDVESFPPTLEIQSTITLDMDSGCSREISSGTSNASNNFGQDDLKSYPPTLEVQSTLTSDEDVGCNPETTTCSGNLDQDNVESCPQKLENPSKIALDKDARYNLEIRGKNFTGSSNFGQDYVESFISTLEVQSSIALDKDIGCNSEIHGETSTGFSELDHSKESLSVRLDHSAITSDINVRSDLEAHEEISTNSSNLDSNDSESCTPMLEENSTNTLHKDIRPDQKRNEEILADSTSSENFNTGEITKENVSSALKSLEENIRKVCDDFLQDCNSACENFVEKVLNNLKTTNKLV